MAERVLVVDDDPSFCGFAQFCLAEQGFQVFCAANSEQAAQSGMFWQPQVVLLDCHLASPQSGMALIRWFQSVVPLAPIVMMSADESLDLAADALRRGAFIFWRKADGPTALATVVESAVGEHWRRLAGVQLIGVGRGGAAQPSRHEAISRPMGHHDCPSDAGRGFFDSARASRSRGA